MERQWMRLLDAFQEGLPNKTELNQRKQRLEQEVLDLLVESIIVEDNGITIKHINITDDNSRLLLRGNLKKYPLSTETIIPPALCGRPRQLPH
jgi:hypothetical protein